MLQPITVTAQPGATVEVAQAQQTEPLVSTNTTASTIVHDLFVIGLTAASIFIKNPQTQGHAGAIASLLNSLLNTHFPQQ